LDCHPFHIEVGGIVEAHADTQDEAIALAHELRPLFPGELLVITDEVHEELILGWWLLDYTDPWRAA
jgi:hypothetical protein